MTAPRTTSGANCPVAVMMAPEPITVIAVLSAKVHVCSGCGIILTVGDDECEITDPAFLRRSTPNSLKVDGEIVKKDKKASSEAAKIKSAMKLDRSYDQLTRS